MKINFGKEIIKKFRPNASNESRALGNDVTFKEFVQYLVYPQIDKNQKEITFDHHWERFYNLCHPCLIKYNWIGKYESMNEDSDNVLKIIGANITYPKAPASSGKTIKLLPKQFATLPKELISKLYKVYQKDFEVFDYKIEDVLKSN